MKKRFLLRGVLALITAITIIVLVVAMSNSWYAGNLEYSHQFVIEADGVLYLYMPATTVNTNKSLKPAVAMPYAVANNLYMDVLTEYDSNAPYPSYVSKAASIESYSTDFIFYNGYTRLVQAVDEFGQPLFDEFGQPIYVQRTDSEGQPLFDGDGNPLYQTEPVPANISYYLRIKDNPTEEGHYLDIDEITIKEFYFSYSETPIPDGLPINEENGAIPFLDTNSAKTSGMVRIEGTTELFIHMKLHLTNVDELMDPDFRERFFYIEIELGVVLITS